MEKNKWRDVSIVPAVAALLVLLLVGGVLAGCVARGQFVGEGAVCKPSESRLCSPEDPLILK